MRATPKKKREKKTEFHHVKQLQDTYHSNLSSFYTHNVYKNKNLQLKMSLISQLLNIFFVESRQLGSLSAHEYCV